jgi:hypothetical protein
MVNKFSASNIFQNKKVLYGIGAIIASGLIGSAYYLFNIFKNNLELSEEHKMQIEEIKEEIEEMKGELAIESAIQIISIITKLSDEIFFKNKSDIHERRRASINKNDEYIKFCKETFKLKEKALKEANRAVLYQFGNISYDKIQKILRKISPYDLESITYKFNHPTFEGNVPPDKNTVKQAFKFYADRFIEEIEIFHSKEGTNSVDLNSSQNINYSNLRENQLIFQLLVIKIKIDDELYIKFKYTEDQIRYLLYEYQLFEDPDVRKLYENVNLQLQFVKSINN